MSDKFSYEVTKGKDSEVKVKVLIKTELVSETQDRVYNELKDTVTVRGFRPGKAPKSEIVARLGTTLLDKTLNKLLPEVTAQIVDKENLNPVTQVEYTFEEVSDNGELSFSFSFVNYPEVKLGDIEKIKVTPTEIEIEQKEIDEVIQKLFKQDNIDEVDLATVTDEKVAELKLEGVNTLAELRDQIEHRIYHIKEHDLQREYQDKVLEAAIASSTIPIPKPLLEQQANQMYQDHIAQIEKLGVSVSEFLTAQGLDEEKLKQQKTKEAELRVQAELLLNEIARAHSLIPSMADVEAEIDAIEDPSIRNNYDNYQGKRHVLSLLIQQRGMQKLIETVTKNSPKRKNTHHHHDAEEEAVEGEETKPVEKKKAKPKKSK